jgi:hypothetical protein
VVNCGHRDLLLHSIVTAQQLFVIRTNRRDQLSIAAPLSLSLSLLDSFSPRTDPWIRSSIRLLCTAHFESLNCRRLVESVFCKHLHSHTFVRLGPTRVCSDFEVLLDFPVHRTTHAHQLTTATTSTGNRLPLFLSQHTRVRFYLLLFRISSAFSHALSLSLSWNTCPSTHALRTTINRFRSIVCYDHNR